jgi:hypothetical protein
MQRAVSVGLREADKNAKNKEGKKKPSDRTRSPDVENRKRGCRTKLYRMFIRIFFVA